MQILPELKKWGATGLLVEYEDVFPYKEKYEVLRAKNSYRYTSYQYTIGPNLQINLHATYES